jgi:hypothetical protein
MRGGKMYTENSHLHSFTWVPVPHLKITYLLKHNPEKYFHNRYEFSFMPCDYCTKPSVTAPDSNKNSNCGHHTSLDLWIANRLTRTVHKDTSKVQWFQNHYYSQKIANKVQSRGQLTSMPLNGQSCSKKSKSGIQQASIYTLLHMQLAQKQTRSPMKTELPQDNQQITVLNLRHITQKESSDSPGLICLIGFLHCKHWDAWPSVTALVIAHKGSAGSTENQTAAPANQHWDPTNRP